MLPVSVTWPWGRPDVDSLHSSVVARTCLVVGSSRALALGRSPLLAVSVVVDAMVMVNSGAALTSLRAARSAVAGVTLMVMRAATSAEVGPVAWASSCKVVVLQ